MSKKEIEELEKLASEFIIGHKPLSERQKELLEIAERLQNKLNALHREEKQIIRIINRVNNKLLEESNK